MVLSFIQGAGHGGTHPHLVNEIVTALSRIASPGRTRAVGNRTCGALAHQSALKGVWKSSALPDFTWRDYGAVAKYPARSRALATKRSQSITRRVGSSSP